MMKNPHKCLLPIVYTEVYDEVPKKKIWPCQNLLIINVLGSCGTNLLVPANNDFCYKEWLRQGECCREVHLAQHHPCRATARLLARHTTQPSLQLKNQLVLQTTVGHTLTPYSISNRTQLVCHISCIQISFSLSPPPPNCYPFPSVFGTAVPYPVSLQCRSDLYPLLFHCFTNI